MYIYSWTDNNLSLKLLDQFRKAVCVLVDSYD